MCLKAIAPVTDEVAICSSMSINGYCCKGANFPDGGGFCTCRRWTCEETSSGCDCGSSSTGGANKCLKSWPTCCKYTVGTATNCKCYDFATTCDSGEKVSACDIADVPCGGGESPIAACKEQ